MATQESTRCISKIAAADLSTHQYKFVELTAAHTVSLCNAITDKALGVLQDKPAAAGRNCSVAVEGTTKVVANAAIAVGAYVAPAATGKAQTAVSTQFPRGIALEAAGADGDIIEIQLLHGGVPLP